MKKDLPAYLKPVSFPPKTTPPDTGSPAVYRLLSLPPRGSLYPCFIQRRASGISPDVCTQDDSPLYPLTKPGLIK